jgi:hypothetical protein
MVLAHAERDYQQDHGAWTSACETKAPIVFTACANSAASPIGSETMNTAAIASRPFSIGRRSRSARLRGNVAGDGEVVLVDAIAVLP